MNLEKLILKNIFTHSYLLNSQYWKIFLDFHHLNEIEATHNNHYKIFENNSPLPYLSLKSIDKRCLRIVR